MQYCLGFCRRAAYFVIASIGVAPHIWGPHLCLRYLLNGVPSLCFDALFHLGAPLIVRLMASCLEAIGSLSRDHDADDSDIHGHNVDGDGAGMRICKISIVLMSQYRWC